MNTPRFFLLLALFVFLAGCGGDPHEAILEESVDLMNEMVSILESVDSEDDIDRASKEMADVAKELEALGERMEEIGDPPPEKEAELSKKFEAEMQEGMQRMQAAMGKVMALGPEAMDKLGSAVQEAMSGFGG